MRMRILLGTIIIGLIFIGLLGCSDDNTVNIVGSTRNQISGNAQPGVDVALLDANGGQLATPVQSDSDGRFDFRGILSQTFFFETSTLDDSLVRSFFGPVNDVASKTDSVVVLQQLTPVQLQAIAGVTTPVDDTATVVAFGDQDGGTVTIQVGVFTPSLPGSPAVLEGIAPGTYDITVVVTPDNDNPKNFFGNTPQTIVFRNVTLAANTITVFQTSLGVDEDNLINKHSGPSDVDDK